MGRNEDLESLLFHGPENPLHVFDCIVLPDTFPDQCPREAFITQHIILWIDEDDSGIRFINVHWRSLRSLEIFVEDRNPVYYVPAGK